MRRQRSRAGSAARHTRPWTRVGVVGVAAHVFYELAAGVAVPFASRVGVVPAAAFYGAGSVWVWRLSERQPASRDRLFSLVNGAFLSAVVGHFTSWPRTTVGGLPYLVECEGLSGRLMPAYNAVLYVSGAAAVGGLVENRRGGWYGVAVPLVLVPLFRLEAPREFARLRLQARRRPRWWNRRL